MCPPATLQESATQTVIVAGASGFIARHIVQRLLTRGHAVRAGLRAPGRAAEARAAVAPGLPPGRDADDAAMWTDLAHPTASADVRSKTLAERAASDIAAANPGVALTAINPASSRGRRSMRAMAPRSG